MDDTTLVESVWMQALQVFTPAGLLLVATLGTMLTMCSTLLVVDIVQPSCLMRFKLQPSRPSESHMIYAAKLAAFNVLVLHVPMTLAFDAQRLGIQTTAPLPSAPLALLHIVLLFLLNDGFAFWQHRLEHEWKWLYKNVHKWHHTFPKPFAYSFIAMHPVEFLLGAVSSGIPVTLLRPHLFTVVVFSMLRLYQGIMEHSGYRFPWDPAHYVPLLTDSSFHDKHHSRNCGNYGDILWLWDVLCGSVIPEERVAKRRSK